MDPVLTNPRDPLPRRLQPHRDIDVDPRNRVRCRQRRLLDPQRPPSGHDPDFQGHGRVSVDGRQEGVCVALEGPVDRGRGLPGGFLQRQRLFIFAAGWAAGAGFLVALALGLRRCGGIGHRAKPFMDILG